MSIPVPQIQPVLVGGKYHLMLRHNDGVAVEIATSAEQFSYEEIALLKRMYTEGYVMCLRSEGWREPVYQRTLEMLQEAKG